MNSHEFYFDFDQNTEAGKNEVNERNTVANLSDHTGGLKNTVYDITTAKITSVDPIVFDGNDPSGQGSSNYHFNDDTVFLYQKAQGTGDYTRWDDTSIPGIKTPTLVWGEGANRHDTLRVHFQVCRLPTSSPCNVGIRNSSNYTTPIYFPATLTWGQQIKIVPMRPNNQFSTVDVQLTDLSFSASSAEFMGRGIGFRQAS